MNRAEGGPIHRRHRNRERLVLPLIRPLHWLRLHGVADRLAAWAGFYVVGERGPEWFIPADPYTVSLAQKAIIRAVRKTK